MTQITNIVKDHPEWLVTPQAPLSLMKFSTPTSGSRGSGGKVILFVFERGQANPTLCVKTVRVYSAAESIRQHHRSLELLNRGVVGTEYASLFAQPLCLHDDGEVIFSIETMCRGVKFAAGNQPLELVLQRYIAWQSHLAKTGVLVQHGDMTPDNILVHNGAVAFIDYDYVSTHWLPGFDIFNFLAKVKHRPGTLREMYYTYLPKYFAAIGSPIKLTDEVLFGYYQQELERKNRLVGKDLVTLRADFTTLLHQ